MNSIEKNYRAAKKKMGVRGKVEPGTLIKKSRELSPKIRLAIKGLV